MKRETIKLFIAMALLVGLSAIAQENPKPESAAQTDDPANNVQGNSSFAPGDVLGTIPMGIAGNTPVGAEAFGSDLLITYLGGGEITVQDLAGNLVSSFAGVGNPIGVTSDGANIYQTDTVNQAVQIFNLAGTNTGSFDVSGETTFPEGITYNPDTGNLYVVNGSGENIVAEYTTAGALVATYPVNGSSQDGIAYDGAGYYYIYDSGTDTIRRYDGGFNQVEAFGGTAAAGFGNGEGLAYANNTIYVVATGADLIVAFDAGRLTVPTLGEWGLMGMIGLMLMAGVVVMRRRQAV